MNKPMKLLVGLLLLSSVAIPLMYNDYMKPIRFHADGTVSSIEWKSRNHGMPVIGIRIENGTIKTFTSNRITLTSEKISIGDSFRKVSDSKYCDINENSVLCVN